MFFSRQSSPILFPTSSAAPCSAAQQADHQQASLTDAYRQCTPQSSSSTSTRCWLKAKSWTDWLLKLQPTLSAPSFPFSCSLMSGDKVDVAQRVLPIASSITCIRSELFALKPRQPSKGLKSPDTISPNSAKGH